jgi:calcium/calmodulin-dependent protein kinase I
VSLREVRAAARSEISSGNWDSGEADTRYYITFELAIGGELFDRITQRGRFTEKDAVECIR